MLPSVAQLLPKLTTVTAGQDPKTVLTAGRINAIQEILHQLVRLSITEHRFSADGSLATGNGDDPYILGSTLQGSTGYSSNPVKYGGWDNKGPGWTGSEAVWGGTAATDTWHRDRPPLIPGSTSAATDRRSFGVSLVLIREYSDTYGKKTFIRKPVFDTLGELVSVGAEVLFANEVPEACTHVTPHTMEVLTTGTASTQTWSRSSPPVGTDGVIIPSEVRVWVQDNGDGTFTQRMFTREKKFDSCGELYYIGVEAIVESGIITGSGSSGGGF
jgi:hypothetical protein